jgi:streptogramin lyase
VGRVAVSDGTIATVATEEGNEAFMGNYPSIAVDDTHIYWTVVNQPAVKRALKEGGAVETVASPDSGDVFGVAVDQGVVYWTNPKAGTISQTPAEGGKSSLLAERQSSPRYLHVDPTHVYWTNDGGQVMRIARSGGSPETIASAQTPGAITADASYVYWAGVSCSVTKVPLAGGLPVCVVSGSSSMLASDETSLCWTSSAGGDGNGTVSCIQK